MKTHSSHALSSRRQQGSAVLVVIVFLSVIGALLVGNALTLRSLKREIRLVDERQKARIAAQARDAAAEAP